MAKFSVQPGAVIDGFTIGECVHSGGMATLYAHLSRVDVAIGQVVQQGQEVGLIGTTGASTGPHLHFEVRTLNKPVDPMPYLPPRP